MSSVDEGLEVLIESIKDSEVYTEYRRQLENVNSKPGLKERIDAYRKENYDMQNSPDLDLNAIEWFREAHMDFRQDPDVDAFLAAELDFCRMIQRMQFKLIDAIDFQ